MNTQVCANCNNKKVINRTDNRLVTESCGHVKCMDCLLQEKSGCVACTETNGKQDKISKLGDDVMFLDVNTYDVAIEYDGSIECEDLSKKKKPETSHIKVETDANGTKCYVCTVCKKKFQSRNHVSYHAYCNGQRKPYQCNECKQSFVSQSHYKYHMRVHRNEKTYSCDICAMSFIQMSKLKRHKLKHTKEKMFSCTQCSKAFNNLSALRKHTLTHTEERPYSCDTCGQRFRDSSNYRKHVEKHKEPRWSCNVCGHIAESRRAMQQHSRAHGAAASSVVLPRRKHQCPRCPQAFHSRKDMRRHAAVHTDSKPFRCKLCDRRFRRKDNLERHIRNTHPDFVPAAAVECDEGALQRMASGETEVAADVAAEAYEKSEKTKLEILNPLPPLPQDVIQKHIADRATSDTADTANKLSILEANHARQSVIVEKRNADSEKVPSPENEYVHKIRKAIVPLPPIDQEKFQNVRRGYLPDSMTVTPIKNVEIYKKILYGKVEKEPSEVIQNPKMHWRRKMEQNINWTDSFIRDVFAEYSQQFL